MEIRNATEADLEGILEIYNHAILHTTAVYNYEAHTLEMRKKWFSDKQEAGHPVLVATMDGKLVGFASFGPFRAWAAYKYSMESSVYVHPDYQGRGIGKALLTELISVAKAAEVHTLLAGIDADNQASKALHAQLGFKSIGIFRQVGYKFGKWLDLDFYQLLLSGPKEPKDGN